MSEAVFVGLPRRLVKLTIDGREFEVAEGSTILDACRRMQIDTPTLCQLDNLTPVNVCRVCVVEVEGSRVLVPACSRCILCYKCVEACGVDAQNTFAIGVVGRGFDAHISTEFDTPLPDSACVYCGNCIGVCPTGALMFKSEHEMRAAGTWDESRQTVTE